MEKLKRVLSHKIEVQHFFTKGIWRIDTNSLPTTKAGMIKLLRMFVLSFRGFREDNCILRASALTFYTVLSIVPVLAMAFGIAKGFGFESILQQELLERFMFQQEALAKIIEFARNLLEKTKGGLIAGISVGILLWTVIKVLSHIELSLNQIWDVEKTRSISRKFNDYFAIMVICPGLVIVHSSLSVFITVHVKMITQKVALIGIFSPIIFSLLKILPYALMWIVLSYLYKVLPFTNVKLISAVAAGVLAGTIFQLAQWGYLYFQVGVAQYNAIYGSFAALPLFLVWMQVSWIIVLFGAEFSSAFQNVDLYVYEPDTSRISNSHQKLLYLSIIHQLIQNFHEAKPPSTPREISKKSGIPLSFVMKALKKMAEANLITLVNRGDDKEPGYQPASDIHKFTVESVIDALENKGSDIIPIEKNTAAEHFEKALESFRDCARNSPDNRPLVDIRTSK